MLKLALVQRDSNPVFGEEDGGLGWRASARDLQRRAGHQIRIERASYPKRVGKESGFSLIELLIVVAVILIVAAIAIPNFLRAKMAANEASAATALKLIGTANVGYLSSYGQGYAGTLAQLGPPSGGCASISSACADLLDSLVSGVNPASATPIKSGYRFTYYAQNAVPTPSTPNNTYAVTATPITPRNTGQSTFCFDNTISIFKDAAGTLTTADDRGCVFTWPLGGSVGPL